MFIRYTNTTKPLRIQAPKNHQVLFAGESLVNKSKQDTKLLVEDPMPNSKKLFYQSVGKSKPQKRLKKIFCIENKVEYDGFIETKALDESKMKTKNSHNYLIQKPTTDQGKTLGKNL